MRKTIKRATTAIAIALIGTLAFAGCGNSTERANYEERTQLAAEYDRTSSLELTNLQAKREREDDPEAIRYLYLMSYGDIVGYYVTKGKVSSNASQIAPESEMIRRCDTCDTFVVESAKDDGSYGAGDPGIFFFTSDGTMVETDLDYLMSDAPLSIDVPRLGG